MKLLWDADCDLSSAITASLQQAMRLVDTWPTIHTILSQLSVVLLNVYMTEPNASSPKPSTIAKEKKHLSSVLVSNRYPSLFV